MSNHQSFLKMIGMEEEGPEALAEEFAHEEDTEQEVIEQIVEEHTEEEAQKYTSHPEWSVTEEATRVGAEETSVFERTEIYDESQELPGFNPTNADKTSVYTPGEYVGLVTNLGVVEPVRSEEASVRTSFLDVSRSLKSVSAEKSRHTVPFDYEKLPEKSSTGTAHFDYDQEQGVNRIVVLDGKVNAQAFHLVQFPLRFGRDATNEVILDDFNVSRLHAEIREQDGQFIIVDLGSTNGVKVNGARIKEYALHCHDIVQMGDAMFEFLSPGVISQGVPKNVVIESEDSQKPKRAFSIFKNKRNMALAALMVFVAGAWALKNFGYFSRPTGRIAEIAQKESMKIVAGKIEKEIADLKSGVEAQYQKPLSELPSSDIKRIFIQRLERSSLAAFIPQEYRNQLQKVSPELLKIFMENEKILPGIIAQGLQPQAIQAALKGLMRDFVNEKKFKSALDVGVAILEINPNDTSVGESVGKLKQLMQGEMEGERPSVKGPSAADEKKFRDYMIQHEGFFNDLVRKKRTKEALAFAHQVRANLIQLKKLEPAFTKLSDEEVTLWDQKISILNRKSGETKARVEAVEPQSVDISEGNALFAEIKALMNANDVTAAQKMIEQFLKRYSVHPRKRDVLAFKDELNQMVQSSFATSKATIEKFLQAESYESAWQELYRFLDVMPNHADALEVRRLVDRQTSARAMQYYNQARVFEFEADDLVAAEQYYKRAIEVADPRGELTKKAARRYAEVRRKTIQ